MTIDERIDALLDEQDRRVGLAVVQDRFERIASAVLADIRADPEVETAFTRSLIADEVTRMVNDGRIPAPRAATISPQ